MLTYTTEQLAEELHCDRHKVDALRRAGIFQGIRRGKTFIFYDAQVRETLSTLAEMQADISNEDRIKETAERMIVWQQQKQFHMTHCS